MPPEVALTVTVRGSASWLSVTASSGAAVFTGTLPPGATRIFRDPSRLSLVVGNAGAVNLAVNGRNLGAAGAPGQVARLDVVPDSGLPAHGGG